MDNFNYEPTWCKTPLGEELNPDKCKLISKTSFPEPKNFDPADLSEDDLKKVIQFIDKNCGYAISDALSYMYDVDLNECWGEFDEASEDSKNTARQYVKACDYLDCDDNNASEWLKNNY